MSPEIASAWLKLTGKKRSPEFSHSLDRELPDSSPKTGRSTSAARGFSGSLLVLSGFARPVVVEYRRFLPRPR